MSKDQPKELGYLAVDRNLFNHGLWMEERTFSKFEALLDLIQLARFQDSQTGQMIAGKWTTWGRGEHPVSLRYLAERWSWSKNKVDDFLRFLEKQGMIERLSNAGQTRVSILNYEKYNKKGQQKGHTKGQQNPLPDCVSDEQGDSEKDSKGEMEGTARGQRGDKSNRDNSVNRDNRYISIDLPFEDFWNLYDKKVGNKQKLQKKWQKLTAEERKKIMDYLPVYKTAQPDSFFRKNPETFLNNRSWEDEIIIPAISKNGYGKHQPQADVIPLRASAGKL